MSRTSKPPAGFYLQLGQLAPMGQIGKLCNHTVKLHTHKNLARSSLLHHINNNEC